MSRMLAAALLVLLAAPLSAQPAGQQGAARYLQVVTLAAEPGGAPAWEAYETQVQEARRRLGVERSVQIYQVRLGGAPGQYQAVVAFEDFAEMEGWRAPGAVMAEVHGAEQARRMDPGTIRAVENAVLEVQADISSGEARGGPRARYLQIVETEIDPAREADYRMFLRSLAAAEDAQGARAIRRIATLGPAFKFYSATGYASLGELRSGPPPIARMTELYGQELAEEIWARGSAAVRTRRVFVMELREDLSYIVD